MFDISFSELLVIAVVALIVIGPEKLPKLARTAGAFMGRIQKFVAQVKDEVNREVRFSELQQLQQEVKAGVNQAQNSIMAHVNDIDATLHQASLSNDNNPADNNRAKSNRVKSNRVKTDRVKPKVDTSAQATTKRTQKTADVDAKLNIKTEQKVQNKKPVKKSSAAKKALT